MTASPIRTAADGAMRVAVPARGSQMSLFAGDAVASVLAKLGKGWRICVGSVALATLSQRVGLVITAAGSNGRTT